MLSFDLAKPVLAWDEFYWHEAPPVNQASFLLAYSQAKLCLGEVGYTKL